MTCFVSFCLHFEGKIAYTVVKSCYKPKKAERFPESE